MASSDLGGPLLEVPLTEFVDRFRAWVTAHQRQLDPLIAACGDFEERVARVRQLRRLLCDHEWGLYGWPQTAGGRGGTSLHRAAIMEELYRVGWHGPAIFEHLEIVAPTLVRFGGPSFCASVLPSFLAGTHAWAQGFSEPEAGSDLASLRTRATLDGDAFVITGSKIWTSWAKHADWCMALVRTGSVEDRHRGLTMVAVDLRSPGVLVRPIKQANGTDELAEVTFHDVRAPVAQVIGNIGGGWDVAMFLLARERGKFAWLRQCGYRQRLTSSAKTTREVHDRQAGELVLQTAGVRAAAVNLLTRDAGGQELGPEAAFNKLLMTRTEQSLYNFVRETDGLRIGLPDTCDEDIVLQQDYLFSRIVTIYGGSEQMQLMTVARHILGLS